MAEEYDQAIIEENRPVINTGVAKREYFNVVTGALLGATLPVVAIRYIFFHDFPNQSVLGESCAWVCSTLASLPFSFYGLLGGAYIGAGEATKLQRNRIKKEKMRCLEYALNIGEITQDKADEIKQRVLRR